MTISFVNGEEFFDSFKRLNPDKRCQYGKEKVQKGAQCFLMFSLFNVQVTLKKVNFRHMRQVTNVQGVFGIIFSKPEGHYCHLLFKVNRRGYLRLGISKYIMCVQLTCS